MFQSLKKLLWILLLASGPQAAWAFSLGGPIGNTSDNWQVSTIGYGIGGDLVAPKNLGEEYRRNAQVYYYACDASFFDFYGASGADAIDQAFTILNNSLTNVNAFSDGLTEFPFNSQALNYQASALGLIDLKSETLGAMLEQLGLANPVRYAWTLHNRVLPPSAQCPAYIYLVVQRNFDFTTTPLNQLLYSPYVNGTLWTYLLIENCPASVTPESYCQPVQVDPLADGVTAVAGNASSLARGGYYIGLTRDDMGGLRYLLTTNNVNYESPAPGSVLLSSTQTGGTTYGAPFPLVTLDYNTFWWAARTNDPVTLSNLYPGLIITSSSNIYFIQYTTNYFAYYTNLIGAPSGSQTLVAGSTVTWALVTNYYDTFANVVTYRTNANSSYTVTTVQAQQLSGAPAGTLTTNTSTRTVTVYKVPSGDFYINTNACGPYLIVGSLFTNVVTVTNSTVTASNTTGLFYSQTQTSKSTTHILLAQPILCGAVAGGGGGTNSPGLYQGVGKIRFVKSSFDSLLGQFYQPITNTYSMVLITNSQLVNQTFQRVVTRPDFQFAAADLAAGPAEYPPVINTYGRNVNFDQGNILPGLAGPGTIVPATTVTFDKVGTIFNNVADGDELTGGLAVLTWGSFDGSTNDPVVYPNGTSLANLANQVLAQITPASLPDGTNGVAYPAQTFTIAGGAFTAPYVWSLPTGSLPAGLTLSSTGALSGTPAQSGTFDFTLQLTDVNARSVQWNYSITIQ